MADSSSSSSTTPIQGKYDVFISFRGTDTRDNITSHLYAALCRAKIETFIDNDLSRGDNISDALLKTIAESKISVIIFSENYSDSRWCLDELLQIMKCKNENGQVVIPVFYKVDPSHIRKQSFLSPFGQAFAQFNGHPKVRKWMDALTEAANLSGWDSKVTRPEAELIEKIVGDILNKLYYASSSDYEGLVGITSSIQRIESMLNACSEDVRIIGIWGMGGIGKSTLAGAFFNQTFTQFEGHCFIANVREESQKHGLNILRQKLLAEILKDDNINVATPHLGLSFIRNRLHHKKVLIVLDDVEDPHHLDFIAGGHHWFGRGSVIIITCRDKQVLQNGVDCIYEIPGLDDNEALSLFSRYAFKEKHLADGYHGKLSSKAITYAKGSPLALKILGSYLRGRNKQEQESALRKLDRTPNIVVHHVLLISYDGLDNEEKKLFLNIACLFKGAYIDEVRWFHDACGCSTDIGIRILIDKSLVTVDNYGRVWMHDLLQEMGRQIVREESIEEPGKRSRLWDHGDISHVLIDNTGTEAVKGILLDMCNITRNLSINPGAFESMPNLEFLKIRVDSSIIRLSHSSESLPSTVCLPHGLEYLSSKLRYLHWAQYPLTYLPSNFHPENLVKLKMRGSDIKRLWYGKQNLVHLKEIDLSDSKNLIEIPDLSLATNLQTMYLTKCHSLKNLSTRNLSNLMTLILDGCSCIKKFPELPLGVIELSLSETGIEEVPSTIRNFKSLTTLSLCGCKGLKKFPEVPLEIKHLYLKNTGIEEIPSSICNLKSLIDLDLGGCKRLKNIPTITNKLETLQDISLYVPSKGRKHQEEVNIHARELTDNLHWFSAVERLNFSGSDFQKIPDAIEQLTNLKYLELANCKRLQSLPRLPMNVERIDAAYCLSLEMVASPLSTTTRGVFDSLNEEIHYDFQSCFKLDQNARNSIVAEAQSKLLHWRATSPKTFSQTTLAGWICFPGNDVPDWFNYKNGGSSLIGKLPPNWCNDELCCLVFSIVCEINDFSGYEYLPFPSFEYQIRNNRGDSYSDDNYPFDSCSVDNTVGIQSNQVWLSYYPFIVNTWRMKPNEADYVDEISVEFHFWGETRNHCTIKKCGVHLLYSHDIEDKYICSVVHTNSPCCDLTQSSLEYDDIKESMMQEDEDNGDYVENSCNVVNPVEELVPILRRRKKMKWGCVEMVFKNCFQFLKIDENMFECNF